MDFVKNEEAVWFFTAYHILREGVENALEQCREGKAEEAADILEDVLHDAEDFFYTSIEKFVEENPIPREAVEWILKDIEE